jgi:hypothetical protein
MGCVDRATHRYAGTHIRKSNQSICGYLRNLRPTLMAPSARIRQTRRYANPASSLIPTSCTSSGK